jgi:glycine amidinotransferase
MAPDIRGLGFLPVTTRATSINRPTQTPDPVVNSYNEWDPLEEVIVGVLDGSAILPWEIALQAVKPAEDVATARMYHRAQGGKPVPPHAYAKAQKQLDGFVRILEAEGVTVRRPEPFDHARRHATPEWDCAGGNCQANPRDVLIVIGDEIIEATMSWKSRYFEFLAYRSLVMDYFKRGARWTAAPKPRLGEETFDHNYKRGEQYVTTEHEPVFDAADMARCGRDIFVQRSHVTNQFGVDWLRCHLGDDYTLHVVEFGDDRALHIDATFVPLAPGKVMINPDRPIKEMPGRS